MTARGPTRRTARPAVRAVITTLAWLWVLVPFGYGLQQLLIKIPALFGS